LTQFNGPGSWSKYIRKFERASLAKLPKGVRLYGYGGLDDAGKAAIAYAGLPC
jgi:hypothetical protein